MAEAHPEHRERTLTASAVVVNGPEVVLGRPARGPWQAPQTPQRRDGGVAALRVFMGPGPGSRESSTEAIGAADNRALQ
jgi:hypothetical protein